MGDHKPPKFKRMDFQRKTRREERKKGIIQKRTWGNLFIMEGNIQKTQ